MASDEEIARKVIKEIIEEMDPAERRDFYETIKRLWECFEELRQKEERGKN